MSSVKGKGGRPKQLIEGKMTAIYLDSVSKTRAIVAGQGNISAGIRRALLLFHEQTGGETNGTGAGKNISPSTREKVLTKS